MSTTSAPPPPPAAPPPAGPPPSGPSPQAFARPPARVAPQRSALLQAHVARMIGFVALAGLGALGWAQMVRPAAADALLFCLLVAATAGGLLSAVARRAPPARVRIAVTVLAGVVLLVFALAASGIALRFFGPRGWDDLAGGIAQGLGAVSTVRTPYGGADEWTRIVIVLGGCALLGLAALLAFAPRRRGAFGIPGAAAVALGALYTLPVMQHDIRLPYLAGLLFALLLAAFLWLERVERRSAGMAAALVAVAALTGYVAAPSLDGDRPLLDYEELAQSLSAADTSQYRWNHDYGPLDWPRDGREVLRVSAPHRAYWKAINLVAFDGVRWVHNARQAPDGQETLVYERAWVQRIRVTLRALRTTQFVGAGTTLRIRDTPRNATSLTPGVYETTGEPLRRGHAYRAVVYTPRPTAGQLRRAGSDYSGVQAEYAVLRLPRQAGSETPQPPRGVLPRGDGGPAVFFPRWGETGPPQILGEGGGDATAFIEASPYARVYALAQRLRARADTPFGYVRAVERYLAGDEFSYSERPRPSPVPLAEFLLRDRVGYCQQFSGAMALLLRMGGVPARVASGFSPGARDEERGEYVVRDVDAHSWVEVFVPGVGWVARDPTPAAAPARAQSADLAAEDDDATVAFGGSERALDRAPDAGLAPLPAASAQDSGPSAVVVIGGALAALAVAAIVVALLVRRRRRRQGGHPDAGVDDDLLELHRALRRSGRHAPPQMTLDGLASRFDGTPAKRYVQTLAAARYGYGDGAPTRDQRSALRRELAAGLGLRGRLRAWWALPPIRPIRRVRSRPGDGVVSSKHVV
ncbi:MAG: transglutaminase-like domain-containing protein [Solirubrobacteraceae bacterium]|nr:transglutaminase-like domain-containing protein [Solirubrobacteraceae bacterium]